MPPVRFESNVLLGMLIVVAAGLVGCATTQGPAGAARAGAASDQAVAALDGKPGPSVRPQERTSTTGAPDWVTEYATDPRYFIGIGGAPDTGNPSSDMLAAQKSARNALASEIATTVQSETSLDTRANAKGDTKQSVTVLISERVNLTLDGVQLVDSYHSKKLGYWYYYRLPRDTLDPRPTIAKGVQELLAPLPGRLTLSVGSITFSDTGMSSALSLYLQDQILLALCGKTGITVSAKPQIASLTQHVVENKGEGPARGVEGGGASAHDVLLTGTFFGAAEGKVSVFLRLTDPARDAVLSESSFTLDASLLPPSLLVVPANYATAVAAKEAVAPVGQTASPTFQVQLWTTRGAGATYLDGEDLVVDLTVNRDCYIKIYHIDVSGRVSLILPNQFSRDNFIRAGRVYRIPPSGAPYQFLLGKPYGVEFIKVIASTRPFSDIEEAFTDLGPATHGVLERGLSVTSATEGTESGGGAGTDAPDALRPAEMAQAMVSYTILGRGE